MYLLRQPPDAPKGFPIEIHATLHDSFRINTLYQKFLAIQAQDLIKSSKAKYKKEILEAIQPLAEKYDVSAEKIAEWRKTHVVNPEYNMRFSTHRSLLPPPRNPKSFVSQHPETSKQARRFIPPQSNKVEQVATYSSIAKYLEEITKKSVPYKDFRFPIDEFNDMDSKSQKLILDKVFENEPKLKYVRNFTDKTHQPHLTIDTPSVKTRKISALMFASMTNLEYNRLHFAGKKNKWTPEENLKKFHHEVRTGGRINKIK